MSKIIITGSSSGIGAATSELLLQHAHNVVGLARNHHKFKTSSPHYHPYTVDFEKIDTLEAQLKDIVDAHADADVLIANAGFGIFKNLEELSSAEIQAVMNVNFISQVLFIKAFMPLFKRRQSGKIIIIGSESALQGGKKGSIYCASKFALRGFCQSIRKECANKNIAVTLINPGFVNTPFFTPQKFQPEDKLKHAIQPERIAELILQIICIEDSCLYEEVNLQPITKAVSPAS